MKKKTHEEYVVELAIKNPNIEVVERYINVATPILHKCRIDGYTWSIRPNNILNGNGCPMCSGNIKKTHIEYAEEVAHINPNIEVIGIYKNAKTAILHRCKLDNYGWLAKPNNILAGKGCPKCSGTMKKSHDEYIKNVLNISPHIEVIGQYVDAKTPIMHKCKNHNITWEVTPSNVLQGGGCPMCGGEKTGDKLRKSHEQYVNELKELNKNVLVLGTYVNANTPILHKCLIDGNEWFAAPTNMLFGYGCPQCNESKGEKDIRKWLESRKIDFEQQKKFADCCDKKPLPFDFYLPTYNVAIEYDGGQHYKPIPFFGGDKSFQTRVKHDRIKDDYCLKNNIGLLRIPYYKNIENELNKFLFT